MLTRWYRRLMSALAAVLGRGLPRAAAQTEPSRRLAVLEAVRREIDRLDRRLFDILRQRMRLVQRARAAKAKLARDIVDLVREQAIFEERRAWALEQGLDADDVVKIFEAVVLASRRAQERCPSEADLRRDAPKR
jgi:chorismate mutase